MKEGQDKQQVATANEEWEQHKGGLAQLAGRTVLAKPPRLEAMQEGHKFLPVAEPHRKRRLQSTGWVLVTCMLPLAYMTSYDVRS